MLRKSKGFSMFVSFVGATTALALIGLLGHWQALPDVTFLIGSFGAAAVLVFAAPDSPFSGLRNVIGGQIVSAAVGVLVYKLFGNSPASAGLAVALSITAMQLTRTLHPPGGATSLIAVIGGAKIHQLGFLYVFSPILTSTLILVLISQLVRWSLASKNWSFEVTDDEKIREKKYLLHFNSATPKIASFGNNLNLSILEGGNFLLDVTRANQSLGSIVLETSDELQSAREGIAHSGASIRTLAESAKQKQQICQTGGEQIIELESSMTAIENAAKHLDKILQAVHEIAGQTHLIGEVAKRSKILSFNAQVEAVRAGEHGKGFAVVATEVSTLAAQSAKATVTIQKLLDQSKTTVQQVTQEITSRIDTGLDTTRRTTASFREMAEALESFTYEMAAVNDQAQSQVTRVDKAAKNMNGVARTYQLNTNLYAHMNTIFRAIDIESKKLGSTVEELSDVVSFPAVANALNREASYFRLVEEITNRSRDFNKTSELFSFVLKAICSNTDWPIGHIYVPDARGKEVVSSGIWNIKNPAKFKKFKEVTEAIAFRPGVGLPGRVWENQLPAWIVNVHEDPNFPRAKLAKNIGVKAAFGFPVTVNSKVIAILEFYAEQSIEPDERLLEVLDLVGQQIGRFYERKETLEEIVAA